MRGKLALAAPALVLALASSGRAQDDVERFEREVRPILAERCYRCHGPEVEKPKGGLRVDSREALLRGGTSGAAIVPGDPEQSLLVSAIRYADPTLEMPPEGARLPETERLAIEDWIKRGAPMPKTQVAARPRISWAFAPVANGTPPTVHDLAWARTPLDRFVLAKLEARGLVPSKRADRRTLLRRATFDLTGLAPTEEETASFLDDTRDDAFEKVVDRLLASPRYGERWGRHWLDVARYADSKGYVFNEERRYPYAYTYRDWVIEAFNRDMPYDTFLVQQIAADKLPESSGRSLAALGFLTLGRRFLNNQPDIIDDRIDVVMRGTQGLTVSCARCHDHKFDPIPTRDYYSLYGVFASAHEPAELPLLDAHPRGEAYEAFTRELAAREAEVTAYLQERHKAILGELAKERSIAAYLEAARTPGDPGSLAQKENLRAHAIHRWRAYLATTRKDAAFAVWHALEKTAEKDFAARATEAIAAVGSSSPVLFERTPHNSNELAKRYASFLITQKPAALEVPFDQAELLLNGEEHNKITELRNKVAAVKVDHPGSPPRAMTLEDAPQPFEPHVFVRGNPGNQGEAVPRWFPAVLDKDRKPWRGSGRLELARAIASPQNPLTARVLVNRVWAYHMGAPLVRTPSDFGARSEPPSNPELLDFLARSFMENHWSIKSLHKSILLSETWQQASDDDPGKRAIDPENVLFWKQNRQRLDFEAMRDSLLQLSGELDETQFGRPSDLDSRRRTIYAFVERQNLPATFRTFDFASPDATSPGRFTTTVPQQALYFLNSPFVIDRARGLARIAGEGPPREKIARLYRRLFQREPDGDEIALGERFLARTVEPVPADCWSYGFGEYDRTSHRLKNFTQLPHFTGNAWQGGPTLPDKAIGWCVLHAQGGHPGNDQQHAVARRWTSPAEGHVLIDGKIAHRQKQGDGVRCQIVSSLDGERGQWVVRDGATEARVESVRVSKGSTIDFITDCRTNESYDSFEWTTRIVLPDGEGEWDSTLDFSGPRASRLQAIDQYAHVLLETDECVFID